MAWDDGVLIEPFTIAFAAVYDFSSFRVGKTAAVLGPGPIGLLTLAALKLSTPSLTIVTGTSADVSPRLEIAKKFGADVTINVNEEDPVKKVLELTGGHGVEYVFEAAGVPLLSQGLRMLAKEGEYTAIGHAHGRPIKIESSDYMLLQSKWAKINGMVLEKASVWFTVIDLLSKHKMDLKPVITHRLSLENAPEGFELMQSQKSAKIMIEI
ncbi:MAG: L-iditol 2-dehydrogenase, partial [Thermoproteota archaeon]|nr:L-iditol 2-dehydrogenase [Thermoproteota archaeon]